MFLLFTAALIGDSPAEPAVLPPRPPAVVAAPAPAPTTTTTAPVAVPGPQPMEPSVTRIGPDGYLVTSGEGYGQGPSATDPAYRSHLLGLLCDVKPWFCSYSE